MSTITILENKEIEQKTLRIAYQIYETLGDDEDLILAGISKNGFIFAQKIGKSLEKISETRIAICEVFIDKTNPLKIVNSRFYLTSSTTYNIADRRGNLDTNIYTKDNFAVETGLIKSVRSISTLDFLGIYDGGIMPVGNYTFYFKFSL